MSKNTKIILGVVIGIAVLCIIIAVIGVVALGFAGNKLAQAVHTDPAKVNEIAASVAEFDLPAGFENPFAMDLAGYTFLGYTGSDKQSHIFFLKIPANASASPEELDQMAKQALQSQGNNNYAEMRVVGEQKVTIRGQQVSMTISEGTSSDGHTYRQQAGFFEGKGGLTYVAIEMPTAAWDQNKVDAFLASIQ
jgi:hypothetical protein